MEYLKVFTFKAEPDTKERAAEVLRPRESFSAWVRSLVEKDIEKRKKAQAK